MKKTTAHSQIFYMWMLYITLKKRIDSLWECATKQAVMTVDQWHRHQIIRGPLKSGTAYSGCNGECTTMCMTEICSTCKMKSLRDCVL